MAPEQIGIRTRYRSIVSVIPHPDSLALIRRLARVEPRAMGGFPPVVWDRAEGFQVCDAHGNKWIDFSSAVMLANAGHAHPRIGAAIRRQLDAQLWHCYCNPSAVRLRTVLALKSIMPDYLDKIFLLTTGSEAVECALKLIRLHGQRVTPRKYHIVSHIGAFHGRTMGAQTAGGIATQQAWMGKTPPGFHHIPFPNCAWCPWKKKRYAHCGAECFEKSLAMLRKQRVKPENVAGFIMETFQGPTVAFMPRDYVAAMRQWSRRHRAVMVFDEIQAGFGRTGKWFGFEHYGIEPDLICLSKGLSGSLPISAVAGRAGILDLADPGTMSSTHTGNPLCCAAAIANIEAIKKERLIARVAAMGTVLERLLRGIRRRHPDRISALNGGGLAWAVCLANPVSGAPDIRLAQRVTSACMRRGVLMLQTNRGTLKLAPPLCISKAALCEGIQVVADAIQKEIQNGTPTYSG